MKIEFYGAAGEVTGSCHIVHCNGKRILLDCGMIQGRRKDEERNRDAFPFNPSDIDAVVLSHAHLDHSGRLPLLVKRGFKGPIHAQNATRDLCKVLLLDAASLGERDARWESRRRARKGLDPVEPLFTKEDALDAWERIRGLRYRVIEEILPGIRVRFQDAGHIMGSASVELWLDDLGRKKKIVFSGDLGQYDTPILHDPADIESADVVLMESTYGGRRHRDRSETYKELGEVISAARAERGNILIPAFAIGRSQEVLYTLGKHYEEWDMDRWQVFLDSPMAIEASHVYWEYEHLYDEEATRLRKKLNEMPQLRNLHLTAKTEQSMFINSVHSGAIIIAGSGMCTGGRIVHHLKHNLWRRECHVVIVGYQAHGTLGRKLVEGKKRIKLFGEVIRVQAKIHTIGGLSAHGDENDLTRWYKAIPGTPPVYLVHGEREAQHELGRKLEKELDARVRLPDPGEILEL